MEGGVFVGRARELADLERRVAAAREGSGALVLVEGETGAGKTALAHSVVRPLPARERHDAGTPEVTRLGTHSAARSVSVHHLSRIRTSFLDGIGRMSFGRAPRGGRRR